MKTSIMLVDYVTFRRYNHEKLIEYCRHIGIDLGCSPLTGQLFIILIKYCMKIVHEKIASIPNEKHQEKLDFFINFPIESMKFERLKNIPKKLEEAVLFIQEMGFYLPDFVEVENNLVHVMEDSKDIQMLEEISLINSIYDALKNTLGFCFGIIGNKHIFYKTSSEFKNNERVRIFNKLSDFNLENIEKYKGIIH